ncbi:NlpC/P60 family protein [Endozoicomonas sp. Mp262]|uniref:NlpC/P60 family protein n=1 Tax=Endozoicomonas sp. Mp262 TaxID=2919499 RepID=UPI0021DA68A7
MNWILDYLGKPWIAYARGPDAYDCWGLIIDVLQRHFDSSINQHGNVITDDRAGITQAFYQELQSGVWRKSETASHGSIVVCWQEKDGQLLVRHVGLYLSVDGGGVLHSREQAGVRFDHLHILQRAFTKVEFYEKSHNH